MSERDYDKVIDLWSHEGRISWELISIYWVVQVGLITAVTLLYAQMPPSLGSLKSLGGLKLSIIFLGGVLSSFAWFFIQYRAMMRRQNWFLLGLKIERENLWRFPKRDFSIFHIEEAASSKKQALELFKKECCDEGEIRFRNQRWYEKIGALRIAHWSMFLLGIGWLIFFIISLIVLL